MRILVVGSGGREHALAWKLASNPTLDRLYAAPGNPGIADVATLVPIGATDVDGLARFAESERIDLTMVGPEPPLAAGIADEFASRGLRIFGPTRAAAEIEWSKSFCQGFARRHDIPMAAGESFDDADAAFDYAKSVSPPVVVKADGLASGKGVLICEDHDRAREAIHAILSNRIFGEAGSRVLIEECLEGPEVSVFCLTDGEALLPLEPATDFKRAFDGDKGPNTGSMGAYSPVAWFGEETRDQAIREIVQPVVLGLAEEGRRYVGCVYAQIMVTQKGLKLIEINARFGDPETQVLMPRFGSDFAEASLACAEGNVRNYRITWRKDACVGVTIVPGGYPGEHETGIPIEGLDEVAGLKDVFLFHAGTKLQGSQIVCSGGRTLNVVARGRTVEAARKRAYDAVGRIRMEGMHFRTDIASNA